MDVIVIQRHETDTWSPGAPVFLAVAADEDAAKRWIQDEVDGKHESSYLYAQGKTPDWWIKYGTFSLTITPIRS